MKYALIALLLLIAACTPQDTIDTPGGMPALDPQNGENDPSGDLNPNGTLGGKRGTHTICEDGSCYERNGCPEGYDEFMSQIGPACVKHYGKEDIAEWPTCARSYSGCECTYVSRDTTGTQLSWETAVEGLRCAPENYRDFMVHGGLSGVDEDGEEYAMIA